MKQKNSGFTIVEVTIVVVVIAIITAIGFVTYSRVQADTRDSQRASKMVIVADALEEYHRQKGEYPGCSAMTGSGASVTTNVLVGMDADALLVPDSAVGVTNSFTCTALTGSNKTNYAYVGDGTAACTTGAACSKFTLEYYHEGTSAIKSVKSRFETY